MAIKLENKPNTEAPSSDYPFGRIKDKSGSTNGTPINREVYGDFHQFFAKLMDHAGLTYNDLPDNDYSGFQYFESLLRAIGTKQSANLNDQIYPGVFNIKSTNTNKPTNISANAQLVVSVDETDTDNISQRAFDLSNGAVWARSSSNAGSSWTAWTIIKYAEKVVDIDDWNMDTTASVNVPHGITNLYSKKHTIKVTIRADINGFVDEQNTSDLSIAGRWTLSGPNDLPTAITLNRDSSGAFDNASYNDTSYNRGWIFIYYEP